MNDEHLEVVYNIVMQNMPKKHSFFFIGLEPKNSGTRVKVTASMNVDFMIDLFVSCLSSGNAFGTRYPALEKVDSAIQPYIRGGDYILILVDLRSLAAIKYHICSNLAPSIVQQFLSDMIQAFFQGTMVDLSDDEDVDEVEMPDSFKNFIGGLEL